MKALISQPVTSTARISSPGLGEQPLKEEATRFLERARHQRAGLPAPLQQDAQDGELVGSSPAMQRLRQLIARVAPTGARVLITGETGTGKELVARATCRQSQRAHRPFVAVNCAALSETLLESELFGHERGAFTGAEHTRPGLFEVANGGTLFLDEAGEMTPGLQVKLLRVLDEGVVTRVGSHASRPVDVRLLTATHRDLSAQVARGGFREDLYFRLAVVPIAVPPLRERREDLPALVSHLLSRTCRGLSLPAHSLTPAALALLRGYDFPGNVRELRNLLERACVLSATTLVQPEELLLPAAASLAGDGLDRWAGAQGDSIDLPSTLGRLEALLIDRALKQAHGVQAEAARRLGLSRSDLHYKLQRLRLPAVKIP